MYNQLEEFEKKMWSCVRKHELYRNSDERPILQNNSSIFVLEILEFQSIICTITELLIVTLTFHCLGFASRVFSLAIFAIPITPLN